MKCFFAISLSVFASLALSIDSASIRNETAVASITRTSEGATLDTSTAEGSSSGSPVPDEPTRAKRTLGVDKNVKKEYEIKTKYGTTIKVSKSITYNDGGGLTMTPALIDSIGANRRKLIYALRGYKYCGNGCVSSASSNENESPGDDNIGGGISEVPAQAGGEFGGLGGASSGTAAEAWGQAQTIGGSEGSASSQASAQASSEAEGSSQASAQASSPAEGSSEASAQASSQAEGGAAASSQASAQASSQVQQAGSSSQAAAQGVAQASGQVGISGGCEGYGCEGIIGGAGNPAIVPQVVQGVGWGTGSQVVVGGGTGWEGAPAVGGWPVGCTVEYTGCICSQMMPVLMTPANSYGQLHSYHPMHTFPFSHVVKRHLRSRIRPLLSHRYPTYTFCSQYNPCCTPYRK